MPKHKHSISGTYTRDRGSSKQGYWPHWGNDGTTESIANFLSLTMDEKGNNAAHNNMPPYKAVVYLIKIKDERHGS